MTLNRYNELIQNCDRDIRAGRAHDVRPRLAKLKFTSVPREFRLPLARICRRAGLYSVGLKLLWPVLHPKRKVQAPAEPSEMAEYGVLLLRSGAVPEALEKLSGLDIRQVPDAALFQAYGHFMRWEYEQAVPLLETYLHTGISDYAKAVGKANLAYAWAELRRHREALRLLDENIAWLEPQGHLQLLSNCHAVRAQVYLQEGDHAAARLAIERAREISAKAQSNDQLLIAKLDLISQGLETKSVGPFEQLRALAIQNNDWEALREADLFSLSVRFETVRHLHLYFGTPFAGFRKRMELELGHAPTRLHFVLGEKSAPRFDILTGEINGKAGLNPGTKCHQLIEILLRDFYRPLRIGGLFSELFAGEVFDINNSPDRVHQVLRRTRRWMEETRIPIEISETGGFYALRILGPFSFTVPRDRLLVDHMHLHWTALTRAFPAGHEFTAADVRQRLEISKTSAFRFMNWAIEAGKLNRVGENGRAIQYKLSDAA